VVREIISIFGRGNRRCRGWNALSSSGQHTRVAEHTSLQATSSEPFARGRVRDKMADDAASNLVDVYVQQ
jgi:hypothetical protein